MNREVLAVKAHGKGCLVFRQFQFLELQDLPVDQERLQKNISRAQEREKIFFHPGRDERGRKQGLYGGIGHKEALCFQAKIGVFLFPEVKSQVHGKAGIRRLEIQIRDMEFPLSKKERKSKDMDLME